MVSSSLRLTLGLGVLASVGVVMLATSGCGARSSLGWGGASSSSSSSSTSGSTTTATTVVTTGVTTTAVTTIASTGVTTSTGGCLEGSTIPCGSDVGACKQGVETCHNGVFGACEGAIGPKPEACDGIDENCNHTINDCEPGSGSCTPTLDVVSSTPSSPNCIDFPVMAGSQGSITYQCPGNGGMVSAQLGGISFTGTVTNNNVTLDGFATISPPQSP